MRGFHSKIWNSAFIQWNNETGNKNSTHLWNVDAIPAMLTFTISVWSERCSEIKKRRVSAEHETLLNRAKILLNDIRQRPIISSQDYHHLHTSDENIEKYSYDALVQWIRSITISIERHFLGEIFSETPG